MAKDNNGYQQPWEEIYLSMEHGEGSKKEAPAETNNEIDINQSQLPESFEKTTNFGKATVRKYLPFFSFWLLFLCYSYLVQHLLFSLCDIITNACTITMLFTYLRYMGHYVLWYLFSLALFI